MRVGFLSQYFPPEPGAAAHPGVVADALARRGHDVRVLTGFPSYPRGVLYDGYKQQPRMRDEVNGLPVLRVPYYLSHDASGARRALSMVTFGMSAAAQVGSLRHVDTMLVYASPATTAIPAMTLSRLFNVPHVLYIQDLWPDTVLESGMLAGNELVRQRVERVLSRACLASYRSAARIVVISPSMRDILERRGVPEHKIDVVPNWVDESVFQPSPADPELAAQFTPHALTVMYAGGIGELQGLRHAVEAVSLLGRDAGVHLAILGEGVAKQGLVDQARALGLDDRVSFHAGRPLSDMPAVISAADVQLVSLLDRPLFHGTIPSKVQASLAVGAPVLVSAPGDAASLVTEAGAGLAVPPESPRHLADAMLRLRDLGGSVRAEMGRCGRNLYVTRLSEQSGGEALERALMEAS